MRTFTAAVLRSVNWRVMLAGQVLAALFAVTPWLCAWGQSQQPPLPFLLTKESLTAVCVVLGALAGDEAVRRGWTVLRAFVATLLFASGAAAATQWGVDALFAFSDPLGPAARFIDTFFDVGAVWGTVLLAYLNRRSAARLLANLRFGELERAQTERRLVASRLAEAEAQIDPDTVLAKLASIRDLHVQGDAQADQRLQALIDDLRATVARAT